MRQNTIVVAAPLPQTLRTKLAEQYQLVEMPPGADILAQLNESQKAAIIGILCAGNTPIPTALMDALPALKVISNFAVGFDNIDIPEASKRNLLVCNTPKVLDGAVADLTIGLMLCVARHMVHGDQWVRNGSWEQQGPPPLTTDIRGKTLGLLGMGRIGRTVAKSVQAFDMKVIYHNRRHDKEAEAAQLAEYREREALFKEADFLSVHIPLNEQTKGSVGAQELGWMKSSAFLINTARGAVLDENALIKALENKQIAGAGLDVMVTEPLPQSHPFCRLDNVVLQPHAGSATVETRHAMITLATENLLNALSGQQPQAMVNPEVWSQ